MSASPLLPPHFDLVALDAVDDVGAEAIRRARAGAGEGTLVWARRQSDARTPSGARWHAPAGNLHCALVLEPDYPNAVADQLLHVATISLGAAIAGRIGAMTGLRYRWPGRILLNELLAGRTGIRDDGSGTDPVARLAVAISLNVADHPPNPEPERYNSVHASGSPEVTVIELLEDFARYFLRWINVWAEDRFAPVRAEYARRLDGVGERMAITGPGGAIDGVLLEVDDRGRAVLERDDGGREAIAVADHFGLFRPGTRE